MSHSNKDKNIGFLHTGKMGITVAATAQNTGYDVHWMSSGRSKKTRARAEQLNLVETTSLEALCDECPVIISVCPPHAAADVADQVLQTGFNGVYADVNAISPQQVKRIGERMQAEGISFVDGGIIGPPAWQQNTTMLYLSGNDANTVAQYFVAGPLGVEVIGSEIGKASALKMCFAANSKGSIALLSAILATAEGLGVRNELLNHWSRNGSTFAEDTIKKITATTAKAWRFTGEMEEIASTFESVGMPGGFHMAAYDIYQRLAQFKDQDTPSLDDVLVALLNTEGQ